MKRFLRALPTLSLMVGIGLILAGCSERDALEAQAAANAAVASGNPLLVGLGSLVSIVASRFISKSQVEAKDREDFNDDDGAAMVRKLEQMGYVIQRK